jgi:hypothetical protein
MNKNRVRHLFERFVSDFGGEVLAEILSVPFADFLFRDDQIVSELKTLEEDKLTEYSRELQRLTESWMQQGLIYGFGRFQISLPRLPVHCQREWLDIANRMDYLRNIPFRHLTRDRPSDPTEEPVENLAILNLTINPCVS